MLRINLIKGRTRKICIKWNKIIKIKARFIIKIIWSTKWASLIINGIIIN